MLKSELIRARLVMQGDQVWTRPLPADYHYLTIANELGALFSKYTGRSRGELYAALRDYEGDSLDYPVIRGLASVLEARCAFSNEPPAKPADMRMALFQRGPVTIRPDLFVRTTRNQAVAEVASQRGLTIAQVEAALFADLIEEQVLLDTGEPIAPADLIARYNLELARGLLYWAREVRIVVRDGYKDVFKYLKLFKLMYSVAPLSFSPRLRGEREGGDAVH